MPDDADLIRRAILRDRSAAGEIYDRFAPLVLAIARDATNRPDEVDELIQEIFLRVLSRLSQVRQPETLAGWIVQVSRSQVADFERLRGRRRLRESPLSEDPVESQPVELADTRAQVRSAIASNVEVMATQQGRRQRTHDTIGQARDGRNV